MARQQRKPKGRPISGWVILDKPHGMGSTEAVARIKWLFFAQKAGHAGTLDPLASGMLPIALGDATKTVPFVMDGEKTYRFTVRWGAETTTDDLEGPAVRTSETRPTREAIEALIPRYTGDISQVPPAFSAIKIEGNRAYDLARSGETVEIPARTVTVHKLTVLEMPDDSTTIFEAECGKGTYVRAIARDMGRDLGCFGHVAELRRTAVGAFEEVDLVSTEAIDRAADAGLETLDEAAVASGARARVTDFRPLDGLLLSTETALADLYEVQLTPEQAARVLAGNPVLLRGRDAPAFAEDAYATGHGRLVALGSVEEGAFKPKRVFGGRG